jgi:predicted DCC family thiol-disulfide oxidoreductase YuxK
MCSASAPAGFLADKLRDFAKFCPAPLSRVCACTAPLQQFSSRKTQSASLSKNWRRVMLSLPLPSASTQPELLFYDGHCGLCHRTVLFVLHHDPAGRAFRFAPLQGETFQSRVPAERRAGLPDSIVVRTNEDALLVRSSAFIHILRRLGGGWNFLASVLSLFPRAIRDAAYDFIARVRFRIFGRRDDVCPVTPPELRARFDP